MADQPTMPPPPPAAEDTTKPKKPWWKRWWGIALIILGGVIVIVALTSGDDEDGADDAADEAAASGEPELDPEPPEDEPEPEEEPEPEPESEPAPESEPEPEPEPEPEFVGFGDGTHRVGTDIDPGTYRSTGTGLCYWARLSGFSGELDDIIGNGNSGLEIVAIDASDEGFETSGCGDWVPVEDTYPDTPADSFDDGTFVVGEHIEPGTYRADGSADDLCYWARLSNFSQAGIDGIIANGNNPTVVEISESDAGFTASGCGTWSK